MRKRKIFNFSGAASWNLRYSITQSEEQLQEIVHYIVHELRAPDAALHLLDRLEDSFASLSQIPQRVAMVNEEPWHTSKTHRLRTKFPCIFLDR